MPQCEYKVIMDEDIKARNEMLTWTAAADWRPILMAPIALSNNKVKLYIILEHALGAVAKHGT